MRLRLHILLALTVLAGAACWPFDEKQPLSEMELRRETGTVEVLRDGERIGVDDAIALEVGDVIETSDDSTARLRLQGDRLGEMLSNGRTKVLDTTSLENQAGRLLAHATERMEIAFDEVSVTGEGSLFRVDRGVATTRTAVYRGAVTMSNPGEPRLEVRRLFEATVTANDVPSSSRPYRLLVDDPWDLVFLQNLVSLEEELDRLAAGLKAQLGNRKPKLGYFRALGGSKDVEVMKPFLPQPTEDLLVGFTLADNAGTAFAPAFRRAFSLFRQGGTWGIAAGIMQVRPEVLLADLENIIVATGIADSEGGGTAVFAASDVPSTSGDNGPRADGPGNPGTPGEPDPGEPPGGGGPSPAATCASDDVECQVDQVGEGLPSPVPTSTPTPPASEQNAGDPSPKPSPKPKPNSSADPQPQGTKEEDPGLIDVIGGILDFSR